MSDPEGDAKMDSSSDEDTQGEIDALFPDENEPPGLVHTPPTSNTLNERRFSEISPPMSQEPGDVQAMDNGIMDNGDVGEGPSSGGLYGQDNAPDVSQKNLTIAEREPGATWNTRKQRDDEERTREQVVDTAFHLRKGA
ncbi:MAG: hypothetical protein Q9174_004393 [Haloplaca sp. 1 TL-2023]